MFKKTRKVFADKKIHVKLVKEIIFENPSLLDNGTYYYSRYPRPHFKQKDKQTRLFIKRMFADFFPKTTINKMFNVYFKRFIDLFLIARFSVISNDYNSNELNFNGKMIMPLNRNLEVKIFNFLDEKVLTYFPDKKNVIPQAEVIEALPDDMNITVSEVDLKNQVIIEKLIWAVPYEKLSPTILIRVFDKYNEDLLKSIKGLSPDSFQSYFTQDLLDYYRQNIFTKELLEFLDTYMNTDSLIQNLKILYSFDFKSDLKFNNILFTKDDYYLIDFQSSSQITILSVFFAHKKDLMLNYDFGELISRYKKGKMDYIFKDLFNKFKLNYDKKLRLEYYFISLLSPNNMKFKKISKTQISNTNQNILKQLKIFLNL